VLIFSIKERKLTTVPPKIKVISVSYHRNGIGGMGFYAVIFNESEMGQMIASLFDAPGYCAVYNIEKLSKGDVEFGSNSWRGDVYASVLRPAVEKFLEKEGTYRIGPFSIPSADAIEKMISK